MFVWLRGVGIQRSLRKQKLSPKIDMTIKVDVASYAYNILCNTSRPPK
jgi:hypothetical protein